MKIAIDESPIITSTKVKHRVRGVGYYIKNLKEELLKSSSKDEFVFFTDEKELSSDISVIHYPYFEPFFLSLPYRKRAKTVVTVHDLTPLVFPEYFPSGLKGRIKWEVQKRLLKNMDRIITDSESSKKDVVAYTDIPPEKIDVVYLAASDSFKVIDDKTLLASVKKRYNLPDKFILYVGDVTWNKNLPRLIHAVEKLKIPLVLVGKAIAEKKETSLNPWNQDQVMVQNTTQSNPLFIKPGFVSDEDLPVLYNLATVFAMPSLYEGFGLPLLEAMSCGVPVVTSEEGSIPEVVGDTAHFVDAYKTDSIAKGIKRVIDDKDLRVKMREKGLKRAKKFSWEKTARLTYDAYKKA